MSIKFHGSDDYQICIGDSTSTAGQSRFCLSNGFRYVILLVAALCLTSVCSNMITFNFTMILMELPVDDANASEGTNATRPYTQNEKSLLLYTIAIASILATFPFSVLYTKFGAHYVFLSAGVLSFLSTALVPMAASHGMLAFMVVRALQGISYAANFAAIGVVCSRWATLKQHGFFLSCMTNFSSIAVIVTNPISAYLCESPIFGWEYVYYGHALAGPFIFVLWWSVYSDYPDRHKCVSAKELEQIQDGKTKEHIEIHGYIPYREIFTNKVILVVWFCALADITSAIFLLTYLPTYVSKVLGYDVQMTGFYSSLPALIHIPIKIFSGWFFDSITCISEKNKMRICNTIALVGSGIFFALVGFVPDEYPFVSVIFMTINFSMIATNCGGFYKCGTLVSRQYGHFVVAGIQFLKSFTMFISPLLVNIFVQDESSRYGWRKIFLLMAITLFIANTIFCVVVTDEPAEFTKVPIKEKNGLITTESSKLLENKTISKSL